MEFPNPYFTTKLKIEMLQRWILIHSYLYYDLNYNIVSDERFDNNCHQLYEMRKRFPKTYKKSRFYYAMKEFNGSTGFGFVELLNKEHREIVERDAFYLRRTY